MNKIKLKTKIKVIKKDDIGVKKTPRVKNKNSLEQKRQVLVSTVSTWVDEFRKGRFEDAKVDGILFRDKSPQQT